MPFHVPINILDFIFKGMMIGVIASAPMGPVGILCVQRTLNKGRWYGMATGMGAAASDIIYAAFAGFGMSFVMDFIFKGMMIGMIASAPMGPVGILCVQRTLNKGRWYGMATGVGAAVSDILYAGFAGFGMSFVMDLINNDQNRFYLQMGGSIMLLCFGLYTYKSDPTRKMHQSGQQKGTLWYNTWTAFLVTFSNPLIIFLFLALYAQFAFVLPDHPFEMLVGFASIVGGALLWWWGLTWLVDRIRTKFDTAGIRIINQIIGGAVVIGSVLMLLGLTTNLIRFF